MVTFLIYVLLFVGWIECTFDFYISPVKGLSLTNMFIYMLICWYIINAALKRRQITFNRLTMWFLVLIIIFAASVPYKFMIGEFASIRLFREIVYLKGMLEPIFLFLLIFNLIGDKETCKKAVFGLLVVLMLTVVITLLMVTHLAVIGSWNIEHGGYWPKFAEPNQYGAYLVLMIPLLFSAAISKKGFLAKIFVLLCGGATFSALISSGSRGGLLSFLVSFAIYVIFLLKMRKIEGRSILISFFLICFVMVGSFVFLPQNLIDRTTARITFAEDERELTLDTYSSGRIQTWLFALKYFTKRPILGYGQNGLSHLIEEKFNISYDTHNRYLKYLLDYGIIGFLVYIIIVSHLARAAISQFRKTTDPYGRMLYLSFLCGFLGYCLAVFFVNIYQPRFFIFIYAAVVYRFIDLDRQEMELQMKGEPSLMGKQSRIALT